MAAAKPQTLATTSAFEILGPIMVGPSSSHTAGALRCAQVAASLLEGTIVHVKFTLWNSFAHTYKGHGTDRALVAGILGLSTDDERIRDAFELAKERGLDYSFEVAGDDGSIHPNTVDITMTGENGEITSVRGCSVGGGNIKIVMINSVAIEFTGEYNALFISQYDKPGVLADICSVLEEKEINVAYMRVYREEKGTNAYSVIEIDGSADESVIERLRRLDNIRSVKYLTAEAEK